MNYKHKVSNPRVFDWQSKDSIRELPTSGPSAWGALMGIKDVAEMSGSWVPLWQCDDSWSICHICIMFKVKSWLHNERQRRDTSVQDAIKIQEHMIIVDPSSD